MPVEESESERAYAERQAELTQNLVTYRAGPAQNPEVQSRSFKVIQQQLNNWDVMEGCSGLMDKLTILNQHCSIYNLYNHLTYGSFIDS